jgi:hypothetical protein
MYATVITWRLHESIRDEDAYDAFLREMVGRNIDFARRVGMLDALMMHVEPDTMIGIAVYESAEEAAAAAPIASDMKVTYESALEFVDRVGGPMNDMPSLPGRPSPTETDGALPTYASISTWRLAESLRDEAVFDAYVKRVMEQNVALANEVGLLDVMVIRVSEETIMTVGMYESREAVEAAIQRSTRLYQERFVSDIELLDRKFGRAVDIPQVTGRGE